MKGEGGVRRHFHREVRLRLGVASLVGAVLALLTLLLPGSDGIGAVTRALLGFTGAALAFGLPLLLLLLRSDAAETKARLSGLDAGRTEVDAVVVVAALASLLGIAVMLLGPSSGDDRDRVLRAIVAVATVASAWLAVHTIYAVRYAKLWYAGGDHGIDFSTDKPPAFSDFAYVAFTIGMTYAISDTDLGSTRLRRIALGHAVLSYLLGTVIIATTLNAVLGLLQ